MKLQQSELDKSKKKVDIFQSYSSLQIERNGAGECIFPQNEDRLTPHHLH